MTYKPKSPLTEVSYTRVQALDIAVTGARVDMVILLWWSHRMISGGH